MSLIEQFFSIVEYTGVCEVRANASAICRNCTLISFTEPSLGGSDLSDLKVTEVVEAVNEHLVQRHRGSLIWD